MLPYHFTWPDRAINDSWFFSEWYVFFAVFLGGTLLHEMIYILGWLLFSSSELSDLKSGFQWKSLMPCAHNKKAIRMDEYRIGILAPLVIFGMLPYLAGLVINDPGLIVFGTLFIAMSAGDLIGFFITRKVDREVRVKDHPGKVGVILEEKP